MKACIGLFAVAAIFVVGGGGFGCSHVDHARANYHEDRAERAAEHGHFVKAAKEERKANRAERDAEHDPLP
jgi:hypothetical protein